MSSFLWTDSLFESLRKASYIFHFQNDLNCLSLNWCLEIFLGHFTLLSSPGEICSAYSTGEATTPFFGKPFQEGFMMFLYPIYFITNLGQHGEQRERGFY